MIDEQGKEHTPEDPSVVMLGKAVADGVPVDWEGVREEHPEVGTLIDKLRFVENVVAAHRRISAEEPKEREAGPPNLTAEPPEIER